MRANQPCRTAALPRVPVLGLCGATIAVALLLNGPAAAEQSSPAQRGEARTSPEVNRLSSATIRMIQHSLIQGGYAVDAADGVWGPRTAAALREFQRAKGLDPTGRPDAQSLAALGVPLETASPAPQADARAAPPIATRSPADLDTATIRSIQQALDKRGLQTGPVDGVWGERTTAAIANLQRAHGMPASGEIDAYTLSLLGMLPGGSEDRWQSSRAPGAADLDPAAIRLIQRSLSERGFGTGAVDGVWGKRTEGALREFQRTRGLEPRGEPDVYTLAALGLLPGSR